MNLQQDKYTFFVLYPHLFSGLSILLQAKKKFSTLKYRITFFSRVIQVSKYIKVKRTNNANLEVLNGWRMVHTEQKQLAGLSKAAVLG